MCFQQQNSIAFANDLGVTMFVGSRNARSSLCCLVLYSKRRYTCRTEKHKRKLQPPTYIPRIVFNSEKTCLQFSCNFDKRAPASKQLNALQDSDDSEWEMLPPLTSSKPAAAKPSPAPNSQDVQSLPAQTDSTQETTAITENSSTPAPPPTAAPTAQHKQEPAEISRDNISTVQSAWTASTVTQCSMPASCEQVQHHASFRRSPEQKAEIRVPSYSQNAMQKRTWAAGSQRDPFRIVQDALERIGKVDYRRR